MKGARATVADCTTEVRSLRYVDSPLIVDGAVECAHCGQSCAGDIDVVTFRGREVFVCGHPNCDEHVRIALVEEFNGPPELTEADQRARRAAILRDEVSR